MEAQSQVTAGKTIKEKRAALNQQIAADMGALKIRFWGTKEDPLKALDWFANVKGDFGPTDNQFEIKEPGQVLWRQAAWGKTLFTFQEWMDEKGYRVTNAHLEKNQRKLGKWRGLWVLTIGSLEGSNAIH
jgi:hypothetical protein